MNKICRYNNLNSCSGWISILRSLFLFSLILGNTEMLPSGLKIIVYSFHLPLLFLIEGASIKDYNIKDNADYVIHCLIKPYAIVAIISSALSALLYTADINSAGTTFLFSIDDYVISMNNSSTVFTKYRSVGLIGIFTCLALSRIIYVTVRCLLMRFSKWISAIVVMAIMFTGILTSNIIGFLPWSFDVAMACVPFVMMGDMLRKYCPSFKTMLFGCIFALAVWGILLKNYIQIDVLTRRYPYGILCFICAAAGCIVLASVGCMLTKISVLSKLLRSLSNNLVLFFCVYCIELRFLDWNTWIYEPLGVNPGWITRFLLHLALVSFLSGIIYGARKCTGAIMYSGKTKGENASDNRRIEWADAAKGICILSIILGHSNIDWINQIVFIYDLPVFFLIAGYFLKRTIDADFIKKKAQRLLIPYYVTGVAVSIGKLIIDKGEKPGTQIIKERLSAMIYAAGDSWQEPFEIYGIGAIWFLWALFIALIIVNHFAEHRYRSLIIACIAYIGWSSFERTGIWLPLSIQSAMLASLYVFIGYICRKNNYDPTKMRRSHVICCVLFSAFGIQHFKGFWLVHNYMGNGWFDFFVSLAASSAVIIASGHLCKNNPLTKKVLCFFGRHSLPILCFHVIEMEIIPLGDLNMKISSALSMNPLFSVLMFLVLKILFCAVLTMIFIHIKKIINLVFTGIAHRNQITDI